MLITTWDKRDDAWRANHLTKAEDFLKQLHE
jgi:hypothetical protein